MNTNSLIVNRKIVNKIMKLNKLFISVGLFAAALTGCTNLDVNVESQYTDDPSKGSGVDPMLLVEAKMADVYFHLSGTLGRRYMEAQCLASDEFTALAFDGGYYDDGTYANQALHASRATDASLDWYPDVTSGITKANTVIADLTASGASDKMIAPARAIRAYYTWILMDCFGDAPKMDRVITEGETFERRPRAEIAQWIADELTAIADQLNDTVSAKTYGKPTKWMAKALLAKLYINWAVYTAESVDKYDAATADNEKLQACIDVCDEIIYESEDRFDINGGVDYLHKFAPDNGPHVKDFIYVMPYDAVERAGFQYARPRTFKDMKGLIPNYYGSKEAFTQSFGGNMVVTPEMAARFDALDATDIRRNVVLGGDVYNRDPNTLLPTKERFMYKGQPVTFTKDIKLKIENNTIDVGNDAAAYQQGYHSIKWFIVPNDYNNGRNQSNDLPIFRYADILLMKAEALVRMGEKLDEAMKLVNEVRVYAGATPLTSAPTLEQIYNERAIEFFDENWRRNDMIRFGHYEDEFFPHYKKYDFAKFDKRHRVFPITQRQLDLNPDWKQNDGYEQ